MSGPMNGQAPIVYLVDDEPAVLKALARLLHTAGWETADFPSAESFLAHLGAEPPRPAVLVLDVGLPGLSGLDLQRALGPRADALPIVFLTGKGSIPISVQAMKAGMVDFLTKPVRWPGPDRSGWATRWRRPRPRRRRRRRGASWRTKRFAMAPGAPGQVERHVSGRCWRRWRPGGPAPKQIAGESQHHRARRSEIPSRLRDGAANAGAPLPPNSCHKAAQARRPAGAVGREPLAQSLALANEPLL